MSFHGVIFEKKRMNNLFDSRDTAKIIDRLKKLTPESQKLWGKMEVGQMVAHCNASLETAMGLTSPKMLPFYLRAIGFLLKKSIVSSKPMPKNMGTDKSYIIDDNRNLDQEVAKVIKHIIAFSEGGPDKCTKRPQIFFGSMTPIEWATMQWKHFDHHLRQFGV